MQSQDIRDGSEKASNMSLLDLPEEVIDQILPEIEHHRDLISFACASRLCSHLVIPRHTNYRVLRISATTSAHVWAHLARRPDLACNIREISMSGGVGPCPFESSSLIEDVDRTQRSVDVQREEMVRALGYMPRLNAFSWKYRLLTSNGGPVFEPYLASYV